MTLLDGAAQAAYWTGRLSADLEAVIEDGSPHAIEVARLTLIEFQEWRDGLVAS